MDYKIIGDCILYEKNVPEKYVLSNIELTLELRKGLPYRLFSSKNGLLLSFVEIDLTTPESSKFWPNGCEFRFENKSWSFFTSAFSHSILWCLKDVERMSLSFKVPLEKQFKVPFGDTFSFAQPLNVVARNSTANFSEMISIEVIEGKIEKFHCEKDRYFSLKLRSSDEKQLKIRFFSKREPIDEQKDNLTYREFLKEYTPKSIDEMKRTLAIFALHTAMSNWKDLGPVHAFTAGVNYSFPPRTYFRDSFWTCLSLLSLRTKLELVREQILVLASGVHDDGCPSGVMFLSEEEKALLRQLRDKNPTIKESVRYENDWWSDHHDSGFLFVLLLSQYIENTEDTSILREQLGGETILDKSVKIMLHASKFVENGVFKKPYDCRDWADNVFRNGFVSYDAALYVAASRELSKLLLISNKHKESKLWEDHYFQSKKRFNEVLFDEGKGYFIDFLGSYSEDHLSIDTVVAMIFNVAEDQKAISSLVKMEKLLETRNNSKQPYGDWGVMNVWPNYKRRSHLFGKSAFAYRYHNGSCWPYLSCAYALAKYRYGLDPNYPLLSWWKYCLERGWVNLLEYYSPCYDHGSLHQAWSSYAAAVIKQIR